MNRPNKIYHVACNSKCRCKVKSLRPRVCNYRPLNNNKIFNCGALEYQAGYVIVICTTLLFYKHKNIVDKVGNCAHS